MISPPSGSDGHSQPEMFWLGAQYSRWALTKILGGWIKDGTVGDQEALDIAERICFRNALEVYQLDSTWQGGKVGTATPQ